MQFAFQFESLIFPVSGLLEQLAVWPMVHFRDIRQCLTHAVPPFMQRSGTQFLLLPGALLLVLVHEWMHAAFGILDGDMLAYIDVSKPSRSRGFGGGVTWSIPKRTFFKIFKASMGYLGSSAVFSLMIFSSFNILASKIICFALASLATRRSRRLA